MSIRFSLKSTMELIENTKIFSAETGEEGLEILNKEKIDIAIIDISLPGISGIQVLEKIKEKGIKTHVIMITYMSEVRLAVKAMKIGAKDYFTKPFSLSEVREIVENLIDSIDKNNKKEDIDNPNFIGHSNNILKIKDTVNRIKNSGRHTNVLIEGESGTGKEVVAAYIRDVCMKDKPFVALNCAAIPKSLQESELFGYEKGAFSDAKSTKEGLFEKSNGGILFLDEIGDMDIELQAKLLRVIQEKKFRRIGSTKEIEIDVFLISATNKNIKKLIEKGLFREDLYYRINIIPINIEPLRNRKEDIGELVQYFINHFKHSLNSPVKSINSDTLKILEKYKWQGNIRELKNTIERVMILADKEELTIDDFPEEIKESASSSNSRKKLNQTEKETIEDVLKSHNYNITKASEELGITRTTLRSKMRKYSIDKQ